MQNSALNSSFVNRLKQILESRYGKGLQIRQLMDLNELQSSEAFTRGRDLHIPIQVNGSLLGTAVVPFADDLNQEKRQGVTQLVRMVLEPAMYRWYLEQKESNLEELSKAEPNLENVRVFGDEPELVEPYESPASELISHLIHLEGRSENTNKKIALQLHELTGRWAFVPFNDIKSELETSEDIAKLGAMTIFVEKVEELTPSEQELLLNYISENRSEEEPLILTTSTLKLNDLNAVNIVSNFLDEISINCFEVDRAPVNKETLKEVLELFFLKDSPLLPQ